MIAKIKQTKPCVFSIALKKKKNTGKIIPVTHTMAYMLYGFSTKSSLEMTSC